MGAMVLPACLPPPLLSTCLCVHAPALHFRTPHQREGYVKGNGESDCVGRTFARPLSLVSHGERRRRSNSAIRRHWGVTGVQVSLQDLGAGRRLAAGSTDVFLET